MRLLYLCNLAPRKLGAFEDFIVGIGEGMNDGKDEFVCIFADEPCDEVAVKLKDLNVRWFSVTKWADDTGVHPWAICLPAIKIMLRERPDVVAVHFGNELPSILIITVLSICMVAVKRVSWVWHQRQQIVDPSRYSRYISKIRLVSLFFDHIVVSYKGALRSMRLRGIGEKGVSVIYNSLREIEIPESSHIRNELNIDKDDLVISNVGWLVARKRTHLSVKAFASACKQSERSLHLLLVGDGPEEGNLRELAENLGIDKQVHFLGMRTDVRAILDETDVLIHSSESETCTNVVQEAMAASCPTVMMDAGAAREQVLDGVTGFVVGHDETELLGDKLLEIISNDAKRKAMGQAANKRWRDMFRLATSVTKHCELYKSLSQGALKRQFPDNLGCLSC